MSRSDTALGLDARKGIAGRACEDVAKLTAELLGAPDRERNTAEYYIRPRVRPQVRRTGGQWPR